MASGSSDGGAFDEYVVRVPKNNLKKYNVMRFSSGDQMDFQKWKSAKINRDLSGKKIYQEEEVYPEFGAGSEYGRKRKEEARKLKYGMRKSKFNVDNQPWKLSVSMTTKAPYSAKNKDKDKTITVTKDFVGKKEGGIGEGSMYFVFMQRPDCTFEAYPVESWYNFTRTIKHRTLTDEEAEAEWDKRDKIMNHLNFMARKRLQLTEEQEEAEQEAAMKGKKKPGANKESKSKKEGEAGLLIHDEGEDELLMSESDESSDEEKTKKAKKIKKKNEDVEHEAPDEAVEDSDDGDDEGQEQDYNSDISSEEEIVNEARVVPKGLDEIESSSSSEEEEEAKKQEEEGEKKSKKKKGGGDDGSTSGESEVDSDIEKEGSALFMNKKKNQKGKKGSSSSSRSSTPNNELMTSAVTKNKLQEVAKQLETTGRVSPKGLFGKRQAVDTTDSSSIKRPKLGGGSGTSTPTKDSSQPQNIITEETVRRYLQHKPITTKDLLMKFKTKKTGLTREQIVDTVAKILKRLNPEQKKINGKIHLFLKQS